VDWNAEPNSTPQFDFVLGAHIRILSHLGETREVDELLDKYEQRVPNRDARYIGYCGLRSYALWFRSSFVEAVQWGRKGQDLIEASGVDSSAIVSVRHTLALAERDVGRPEVALSFFLGGRSLSEVLDPEELDEERGEHHYGNIGRCLQFMGQVEPALVCYQKSAIILERSPVTENVSNRAYARMWIGELLAARQELQLAFAFLQSALRVWEQVAPPKATAVRSLMNELEARDGRSLHVQDRDVEHICLDWILGR
jgi:tetratricopeptide (TPR) repeat protein